MTQLIQPPRSQSLNPILSSFVLCLALFALASGSIFMKIATQEMTPYEVAFGRVAIAAIVFIFWNSIRAIAPASNQTNQIGWHEVGLLAIAGASFAAFIVLLTWALAHAPVANATLLTHMMPIFTTLGGWLFFGQQFSRQFWIGLVVALSGAIAIGASDLSLANDTIWGDVAALGAAFFIAIEMLIVEQLRTRLATPTITMSECAIAAILLLPIVLLNQQAILPPSWESGAAVIAAALITQVLGHGLLTYSLKQFSAGLMSVALLAVPIIAAVLAMILFRQMIQVWSAVSFLVVLVGILLTVTAPKAVRP
jgi:drug/metabolite transporter (DMT)-like permease